MATKVWQSTQIPASIDKVWAVVRPLDFKYLRPLVTNVELEGARFCTTQRSISAALCSFRSFFKGKSGPSDVGAVRKVSTR